MLTMDFLKDVLSGKKSLLKVSQLKEVDKIPRYPEIHVPTLWADLKTDEQIKKYFPDSFIYKSRIPQRDYMFSVL